MPDLTLRFDVFCSVCGAGLCETVIENDSVRGKSISIPPCEFCLEKAKDESRAEGYEEGLAEGRAEG